MLDEPDPLECGDPQVSHDFISFMIESLRTDSMAADNDVHMTMINLSEEVRIVAMSCEVAAELGRMVKDLFPKTATIFLGYCYECDYYIPSAKMISEGGYEADRSRSLGLHPGPYVTQIDDLITSAAVELDLRMR